MAARKTASVPDVHAKWSALVSQGASRMNAARELGYHSWSSLRDTFLAHGLSVAVESEVVHVDTVPPPIPPVADILAKRRAEYAQRRKHESARGLVNIRIRDDSGVIGIVVNGDEHLDNPGTDIAAIERMVELVNRTPGLYAASMGDVHDAWVGRLQRLYAESSTTLGEAIALCEWYVSSLGKKLLFAVGGNHNSGWWGDNDPLINLMRANGTLYLDNEVRVALHVNDLPAVTAHARHSWQGRSMWNPGHGTQRAAQMGARDDVLLGGHTHVSAYGMVKQQGTDSVTHCVQVASYKIHDQYARDLGLRDQHISPAVLIILDPAATGAGRVLVFHDIEQGAKVLQAMRG